MIHLDISFLIRALVSGSAEDRSLRQWLASGTGLGVSSVVWAEFLCGPIEEALVQPALRLLREPLAFTADDAALAAQWFNLLGRRRGSLSDCMIAATALRAEATLATANARDFRRLEVEGLKIVTA